MVPPTPTAKTSPEELPQTSRGVCWPRCSPRSRPSRRSAGSLPAVPTANTSAGELPQMPTERSADTAGHVRPGHSIVVQYGAADARHIDVRRRVPPYGPQVRARAGTHRGPGRPVVVQYRATVADARRHRWPRCPRHPWRSGPLPRIHRGPGCALVLQDGAARAHGEDIRRRGAPYAPQVGAGAAGHGRPGPVVVVQDGAARCQQRRRPSGAAPYIAARSAPVPLATGAHTAPSWWRMVPPRAHGVTSDADLPQTPHRLLGHPPANALQASPS